MASLVSAAPTGMAGDYGSTMCAVTRCCWWFKGGDDADMLSFA
ncbi:hypothetical protein [Devosia sp. CAU 1758]